MRGNMLSCIEQSKNGEDRLCQEGVKCQEVSKLADLLDF